MPEVNEEFVERVGERVGMAHGGWDMVDAVELCGAVIVEANGFDVNHARATLESVKDHMDEFAYQELASALNP